MKKVSILLVATFMFVLGATAQTTDNGKKVLTKEEKAAIKAKKEADEVALYKELAITDEQIAKVKEVNLDANTKSNTLKADTKLTDAEKEAAKKIITDTKNAALKIILGDEKFKQMGIIKKRQKEANEATTTATN